MPKFFKEVSTLLGAKTQIDGWPRSFELAHLNGRLDAGTAWNLCHERLKMESQKGAANREGRLLGLVVEYGHDGMTKTL
jgi:hypothetical protein